MGEQHENTRTPHITQKMKTEKYGLLAAWTRPTPNPPTPRTSKWGWLNWTHPKKINMDEKMVEMEKKMERDKWDNLWGKWL